MSRVKTVKSPSSSRSSTSSPAREILLQSLPRFDKPWPKTRKSLLQILPEKKVKQVQLLANVRGSILGVEVYDPTPEVPQGRVNFLLKNDSARSNLLNLQSLHLEGKEYVVTSEEVVDSQANAGGGLVELIAGKHDPATATALVSFQDVERLLTIGHAFDSSLRGTVRWSDPPATPLTGKVDDARLRAGDPLDASLIMLDPHTGKPAPRRPGATRGGPVAAGDQLEVWLRSKNAWVPCRVRTPRASVTLTLPGGRVLTYRRVVTVDLGTPPMNGDCGGPYMSPVPNSLVGMHAGALLTNAAPIAVMLPIANPFSEWGLSLVAV